MSLALIEAEIRRFLATSQPEVLCIKGRWGVGKTYGWKKFLKDAKVADTLALRRYSYVSLFGLNSLEDLRFSVFESTVSGGRIGMSPDAETFNQLIDKSSDLGRRMKPAIEFVGAMFNRKGVADVLFKSAFLAVQNQIICLDDLERAGGGLTARDVLGMASFLKEERRCKVVLLLNDKEHDEKSEFDRQLEKVADVTLVFELTPDEAVKIALTDNNRVTKLLKPRIVELGITNIRVIKKIERFAQRLISSLDGFEDDLIEKAVSTLVLASWAVQQPREAPSLEFLRTYSRIASALRTGRAEGNVQITKYRKLVDGYPFHGPNELDHLIINGAEAGFFQDDNIQWAAKKIQNESKVYSRNSNYSRAWEDLYHGSLITDDSEFLDVLYESASSEAETITPVNINSAIRILREYGRPGQADDLVTRYIAAHESDGYEFFDIAQHHFSPDDSIDVGLQNAFLDKRQVFVDTLNPLDIVKSIGEKRNWSDAGLILLSKQSADDFEKIFEALRGENLRSSVQMILAIGNSHYEGASDIKKASIEALRRIAAKSPLRARKVAGLGVEF